MNKPNTELETKVLDINKEEIIQKLKELGAEEESEVLTRRWVFDIESENIEFIRLRSDGKKHFLTYKYKTLGSVEVGRTEEIEVEVLDFDKTAEILRKLKFKRVFYQETKRHAFHLNEAEITIDTWPKIPPYMEIEAQTEEKIQEILKLLDLEGKDAGDYDIFDIYQKNSLDLHSFEELKF